MSLNAPSRNNVKIPPRSVPFSTIFRLLNLGNGKKLERTQKKKFVRKFSVCVIQVTSRCRLAADGLEHATFSKAQRAKKQQEGLMRRSVENRELESGITGRGVCDEKLLVGTSFFFPRLGVSGLGGCNY